MEVIPEDEAQNAQTIVHANHPQINQSTFYQRPDDEPEQHGGPSGGATIAETRRKTKRSFSTPDGGGLFPRRGRSEDDDESSHDDGHHGDDDDVPLLGDDEDWAKRRLSVPSKLPSREVTAESLGLRTYKTRFYIMFVFFMVTFVNGAICYMFVSTAKTVEFVYGLDVGEVLLLQNMPAIGFLLGVFPLIWLMERKGLRLSVILGALIQLLGALIKLPIKYYPHWARWAFLIGTFLASLGGPLSLVAPTSLSSAWFPSNERMMSTAIAAYSIGIGIGYIVIVEPLFLTIDVRNTSIINTSFTDDANQTQHHREVLFNDMILVFYMQLGLAVFSFLLTVVYFPNKPPTPPTLSAGSQRTEFVAGLKKILRSRAYHALAIINIQYTVGIGYQSALDIFLEPLGFTETEVGLMGGVMLAASTLAAILGGWLGVRFNKRFKSIMLVMFMASGFPMVWFALTVLGYLPAYKALVWASVILSGVGLNAPAAILFEAVVEQTYPVGESISIGWICFLGNLARGVLFALPLLPGVGYRWLNWFMVFMAFMPVPMLLLYKQKYRRLDLDLTVDESSARPGATL